ncbi:MAG: hypothetical protein NDF55_08265 [archaeon GB-1867-005]|nr:hypothetical protein [Candidatus Culexmicrobium cathedralense]
MLPGLVVVSKHLIQRGAKIIYWGFSIDVDMTMNAIKARVPQLKGPNEAAGPGDYKYGEDWVYCGLLPPGEATVAQLADNIHSIIKYDKYSIPVEELPLLQRVKSAKDVSLVITSDTGDYGDYYIRHWNARYNTPIAEVGIAMIYSSYMTYYQTGQVIGLLKGCRGGAEYERLTGAIGEGTRRMDALNASHLLTIFAVIIANLSYFATKKSRSGGGS